MTPRVAWAVARRVLQQLRRDPRTIALIIGVPCLLEFLLQQLFGRNSPVFQHVGAPLLGLFPFVTMFLVTSITMLRERTSGTLERLMTMPLAKVDVLAGYGIAFALVAVVQATVVSILAFGLLGLQVAGPQWVVVALAVANAVLGSTLGLFVSAFAQTEFQAVQFMPAVVFPQFLLCGLFVARDEMATWLRWISAVFPLTYAYDALARAAADMLDARFALDVAIVCGCIVLALVLGAATLRRRTGADGDARVLVHPDPDRAQHVRRPRVRVLHLAGLERTLAALDDEAGGRDDEPGAAAAQQPFQPDGGGAGDDLHPVQPRVEGGGADALESPVSEGLDHVAERGADAVHVRRSADDEHVDVGERVDEIGHVFDRGQPCRHRLLERERDRLGDPLGVAELRVVEDERVHGGLPGRGVPEACAVPAACPSAAPPIPLRVYRARLRCVGLAPWRPTSLPM